MANARRKRKAINEPGHAHELTFSCFRRIPFLKAERTNEWLADSLRDAREALEFDLLAYVFMPDHVHLIVHPRRRDYAVSAILRSIKQPVARRATNFLAAHAPSWMARIRVQRGRRVEHHFWQPGGGYDRNITNGRMLQAMIEYIHANPVRRGLVERPGDWRWSSAGWFLAPPIALNGLKPDVISPDWTDSEGSAP